MTTEIQAAITAAIAALIIAGSQGCAPGTKIWVVADSPGHNQTLPQSRPKPLGAVGRGAIAKETGTPVIALEEGAAPLDRISTKDRRTLARLLKALK